MKTRRDVMSLLAGGAALAWPLAARAQQGERMRRIGVLLPTTANDPRFQAFLAAFHQGLALLGWTVGRNVRIDTRWAAGHAEIRQHVQELVSLAPDVILAMAPPLWDLCCKRPVRYRSCSRPSSIRSVPASSKASLGPAAMPPAS